MTKKKQKTWILTEHAGIYRHYKEDKIRVIATALDPLRDKMKRKERKLSGVSLGQAVLVRETLKEEIRNPEIRSATIESKSITRFAASWMRQMVSEGRWAHTTAKSNVQNFEDHILPVIGHIAVDELTREDIRSWILYTEERLIEEEVEEEGKTKIIQVPYAKSSMQRWWRNVRHLVKALYLEGHVDRRFVDWCRDQPGPQSDVKKRRETQTLTHEELLDLVQAAEEITPDRYAEIITLAFTGMRAGELYGLNWESVNFTGGEIIIEKSYSKGKLKSTKTGLTRTIPISHEVVEALFDHRQRMIKEQNLGLYDGIVFPSRKGTRRDASSLKRTFPRLCDATGIDVKVGPQVLRASYVTLLKQLGYSKKAIMALVGHATVEMHEHYERPRIEDLRPAVEGITKKKESA